MAMAFQTKIQVGEYWGFLFLKDSPEMVPPFTPVDREADYREAWAHFEKVLKEEVVA